MFHVFKVQKQGRFLHSGGFTQVKIWRGQLNI